MNQILHSVVPAQKALQKLKDGNLRFTENATSFEKLACEQRRLALINKQTPHSIILTCSDSRLPTEIIFDQGLGDLFVIRVAGNIIAPSLVGSIEFAASTFGTQLVVVMGHTRCGAITATIDAILNGKTAKSENIHDIVERITPSVESILALNKCREFTHDELIDECIHANIRHGVHHLRHASRLLEKLGQQDQLLVVGAEYSLETGLVTFFDDL